MILRPWSSKGTSTWVSLGLLILVLAGIGQRPLLAQTITASLSGVVSDQTGAVIPAATVTAKNQSNGFLRTVKTNGVGIFSFSSLDSGDYTVTVKAQGFEVNVQKGIHLDPGDARTLSSVKMVPGVETITVTVNADVSSVLETGERSDLITAAQLAHLSTEGRDVTELMKLLPGSAINTGSGSFSSNSASNTTYDPGQVTITGGSGNYAMSGSPVNGVSVRSDGINLNDPGSYSGSTQTVNTDTTAEVKVEQSNFGADTANGPVVINAVGKSGGSTIHGTLYLHGRTYQMNATDALVAGLDPSGHLKKPDDRYIYPGATLGGPLRFPGKNFNHSGRLVFFAQAEDYAQRNVYSYNNPGQAIYHAVVPTPSMLKGDLSPAQIQKYLPPGAASECNDDTCSVTPCGLTGPCYGLWSAVTAVPTEGLVPGPGQDAGGVHINCTNAYSSPTNGCMAPYLDKAALTIMKLLPSPNVGVTSTNPDGQANQNGYNFIKNNLVNNDLWTAHGRIDFAQSELSKIYGVYTIESGFTGVPQGNYYFASGSSGGVNLPGGSIESTNSQSASLHWTRVFSSTLTNEAFASLAYVNQLFNAGDAAELTTASLGEPGLNTSAYENGTKQFPTLNDYGYNGLPIGLFPDYSYGAITTKRMTPGIGDDLTKVWGKHTFKFGVNVEKAMDNSVYPNSGSIPTNGAIQNYYVNPSFQLPTVAPDGTTQLYNYDNSCNNTCGSGTGNNLANFLEGEFFKYLQANTLPKIDLYWWSSAFYATDSWKVRSNLTLTLGLRVEHEGEWQDAHKVGIPVWIPADYQAWAATDSAPTAAHPLPGFRWHSLAGDSSTPNSGQTVTPLFLDPRAGFSLDIRGNGKTVISGGYGWYRFHDNWNDVANALAVSTGQRTISVTNPYSTIGYVGNSNGLTLGYLGSLKLNPSDPSVVLSSLGTTGLFGFDPSDHKQPLTATYSLTLTQQLFGTTLAIGYVGNNSNSILNDGSNGGITVDNVNAIKPNGLFQPDPAQEVVTIKLNSTTNQFYWQLGPNPYAGTTWSPPSLQGMGGNPTLTVPSINDWRPYPLYGQLQLEAHKLFANYNGLQVTWNRSKGWLTYGANYTWSKAMGVRGGYNNGNPGDSFNVWNDYGPLAYDRSHIFNVWYVVALGSHIHGNRVLGAAANNWEISGYTGYQSGPNLQATSYGTNFGLEGQLGPGSIPGNFVNGGVNPTNVSSIVFLGTPDVSLQPLLTCDPRSNLKAHQYINGNCFALPQIGTGNGKLIYPYIHGPGYFQSDLTVRKDFHLNDRQTFQISGAAFNFLNHPLVTFSNVSPNQETLDFINPANYDPTQAIQYNSQFGITPYKVGRRVMEISMKYSF
ncbi:MAG: carboxypeptidase-like regulatory domain-containing protein [Terracidiphilus sp.]